MSKNASLTQANKAKQDEFYTQLSDIERELSHYKSHFENKTVFCNCDDPYESNFFKYFAMNFNELKLKKLITTCYSGSSIVTEQLSLFDVKGLEIKKEDSRKPYKLEINEIRDCNKDGAIDLFDIETIIKNGKNVLTLLKGDGDFRSKECIELLKLSDIVVTNPPFSLFREYIAQLIEYNKNFIILGNQNAVTYKEIFPLLVKNKIWLGYHCGDMSFKVPNYYEARDTRFWIDSSGQKWRSLGNICWFTNLDISKRHEKLLIYKSYNSEAYPEFDNYFAINVDKVSEIPKDYDGAMGVPITFLDKYNPEQFKILNANEYRKNSNVPIKKHGLIKDKDGSINGKPKYARIVIQRLKDDVSEVVNDGN